MTLDYGEVGGGESSAEFSVGYNFYGFIRTWSVMDSDFASS